MLDVVVLAKKQLDISELSKELQPVLDNMVEETDLAAALIGAAYVDESLRAMFHKILVRGKTSDALLNPAGALGNYNVRAKLAYSMGYLTKQERNDLDMIAEIRNRFAHTYEKRSFHDPDILELCNKLKKGIGYDTCVHLGSANPGKACYAFATVWLAGHLQTCGDLTRHAEIGDPFELNRKSWESLQKGHRLFLKHEP